MIFALKVPIVYTLLHETWIDEKAYYFTDKIYELKP